MERYAAQEGPRKGVDRDGWAEIEERLTETELPAIPPTSDPERLLRFVLHIHPKYSEMEMMATHLRLYATSLEQDLEQARNHSRILSSEVASEREKKQFLEKYAAQIVKERNELLHARSAKKSKVAGSAHFTWHSCCKKSGEHSADMMPSMAAFRGERLQEAMNLMRSLQDEVRNQERLRQEVNFMLKRTHREHDSKTTADRKYIQQLEKQLIQRSMLQSTMERKLYEVESALARYDTVKLQEITALEKELDGKNTRVRALESQCERYQRDQGEVEVERDDLQDRLTHVMLLKDELADQVDQLSAELAHAQAEIESLRGEVEVLQSEDVTTIKSMVQSKMDKLQEEWSIREHDLVSQVDTLRQELRTNEILLQRAAVRVEREEAQSNQSEHSGRDEACSSWTRQRNEWLRGSASFDGEPEAGHVGSSLSRSQLSQSAFSDRFGDETHSFSRRTEERFEQSRRSSVGYDSDRSSVRNGGAKLVEDDEATSNYDSIWMRDDDARSNKSGSFGQSLLSTDYETSNIVIPPKGRNSLDGLSRSHIRRHEPVDPAVEVKSDMRDEADGDLLADMKEMLKVFQDRRIQEEQKAEDAEKALANYRQDREGFSNMITPVA